MSNMISDLFGNKSKAGSTPTKAIENPYLSARREWNERYGDYISRARTWQLVALASIGLSAVLGFSLVQIAGQAKVQPFVVEVDKLGDAVAVKRADKAVIPDERIIRYQLANFITNARGVTPDAVVQKRWLDGLYSMSTSSAAQYLNEYYRKTDPFETARTSMVAVDIQTALPLSKDTWQVQWTETRRGLNGLVEGQTRWQAVLTIKMFLPTSPAQIIANPTGVVVEQITWTQQL